MSTVVVTRVAPVPLPSGARQLVLLRYRVDGHRILVVDLVGRDVVRDAHHLFAAIAVLRRSLAEAQDVVGEEELGERQCGPGFVLVRGAVRRPGGGLCDRDGRPSRYVGEYDVRKAARP